MTSYRYILVLAGAACTALIAFASAMAPRAPMPAGEGLALLLGAYALGLGAGRLVWKGRG